MVINNPCLDLENDNIDLKAQRKIDKAIDNYYSQFYKNEKEFKEYVFKKLSIALKEVEEGNVIPMEEALERFKTNFDL